jgi:GT2 family glycosyltransferase
MADASRLATEIHRALAIVKRLRYESVSFQWVPAEHVSVDREGGMRWLGALALEGAAHQALFAHPPSEIAYRINADRGDRFVVQCALIPEAWNRNLGGVEFSVTIATPEGQTLRTQTLIVNPGTVPDQRRWCALRVPLAPDRAQPVTVTLRTRVPDWYAGDSAWAVWGAPTRERRRPSAEMKLLARAVVQRARTEGLRLALRGLGLAGYIDERTPEYRGWAALRAPAPEDVARMAADAAALARKPLISILTPVYNTPPHLLRACRDSVLAQIYPHWEWCVCDDASTSAETKAALAELRDDRIRVMTLDKNAGIAGASQAALGQATGEFIALLDHDDELTPDALYRMARRINDAPDADVLYSDEDKLDEDGGLSEPFFKPDWSPEHLLSTMYTCHLTVARRAIVEQAGGFRPGTDGAQDHDLMLRLMEITSRIEHVPYVLYHWRRTRGSTAAAPSEKPWASDAGRRVVEEYLRRNNLGTEVQSAGAPGQYRPRFEIRGEPRVLIVIVGGGPDACDEVRARTTYANIEVIQTAPVAAEINVAVREHPSDVLLFLDAALEPETPDWVHALLEYAQQAPIGAVGARIRHLDGRVRHIGLVLGAGEGVARSMYLHLGPYGYFSNVIGPRNYSAVSGECLMTRRDLWDEAGGLDEGLPWNVADVDYCLKLQRAGRRVVYTPSAELRVGSRREPALLPDAPAIAALRERWGDALDRDPFYNPNLGTATADYRLAGAED